MKKASPLVGDRAMLSIRERSAYPVQTVRKSALPVPHAVFFAIEIVLLGIIVALSEAVKRHPGPLPGDVKLELDVQHALLPHRALTSALEALSTVNWPVPAAITLAVVVVAFVLLRRWLDALIVVPTAAVADGSGYLLNQFLQRPRPLGYGIHVVKTVTRTFSFPSGHVLYAVAVFGLFLFLTYQIRERVPAIVLWPIRILLSMAIVLMPVSRLLEGQHWPSDVLAGALYGVFWLLIATHGYSWARHHWPGLLARDEQ